MQIHALFFQLSQLPTLEVCREDYRIRHQRGVFLNILSEQVEVVMADGFNQGVFVTLQSQDEYLIPDESDGCFAFHWVVICNIIRMPLYPRWMFLPPAG